MGGSLLWTLKSHLIASEKYFNLQRCILLNWLVGRNGMHFQLEQMSGSQGNVAVDSGLNGAISSKQSQEDFERETELLEANEASSDCNNDYS